MMRCHLLDGEFIDKDLPFDEILKVTKGKWEQFRDMRISDIVSILDELGRELVIDPAYRSLDGVSYLSMWLRRSNLERMLRMEYGDSGVLDGFVRSENIMLRAQPRGVACHWVANNVTTLGAFSMFLSILSKNASLVKASTVNKDHLLAILKKLNSISLEQNGKTIAGSTIVKAVAVVTFEGKDRSLSTIFSQAADCKVIWGGAESVSAISALPMKGSCEVIVFGPKYSLAVMGKDFSTAPNLAKRLGPFVKDVMLFDQMACSSPQVLFVEKGERPLGDIAKELKEAFSESRTITLANMPEDLCANVINVRGTYLLDTGKGILASKDLAWTIMMDDIDGFPDPVHGRCLFLREVDDLSTICDHITSNVQAIELLFDDPAKKLRFSEIATMAGADRIVSPGGSHDFGLPWDGMKVLSRMVRWVTSR
jgi:hypothetical protein